MVYLVDGGGGGSAAGFGALVQEELGAWQVALSQAVSKEYHNGCI